ncbi:MAG: hypothetical protein NTX86_06290 [Candidatus Dependentiae bacterium]|nr:hypothetical protein [Candidatus Dependentiae bacterium]
MKRLKIMGLLVLGFMGFAAQNLFSGCCDALDECQNRMVFRIGKDKTGKITQQRWILRDNNGYGNKITTQNGKCPTPGCDHGISRHTCDCCNMSYGAATVETVPEEAINDFTNKGTVDDFTKLARRKQGLYK